VIFQVVTPPSTHPRGYDFNKLCTLSGSFHVNLETCNSDSVVFVKIFHTLKWFSLLWSQSTPGGHDFMFDSALQQETSMLNWTFWNGGFWEEYIQRFLLYEYNIKMVSLWVSWPLLTLRVKILTKLILCYSRKLPCKFQFFYISGSWEGFKRFFLYKCM
jgi:hypothetical protein